jgi:hypothetical protein
VPVLANWVIIVRHRTRIHSAQMVERLRPRGMPALKPDPAPLTSKTTQLRVFLVRPRGA